jgi:hypothetical protein
MTLLLCLEPARPADFHSEAIPHGWPKNIDLTMPNAFHSSSYAKPEWV